MKKYLFVLLCASTMFFACNNGDNKHSKEFIIKGDVKGAVNGQQIFLEELTPDNRIKLDSVKLNNGQFLFRRTPTEIGFYLLSLDQNNFVTLLIDTCEQIQINADAKGLHKNYTLSGSKGSDIIRELNNRLGHNMNRVDSLSTVFNEKKDDKNFKNIKPKLDSCFNKIFEDQQLFVKKTIDKNLNSLAILVALYQQLGRTPLITPETDFNYFIKADSSLMKIYPTNKHSLALHQSLTNIKRFKAESEIKQGSLKIGAVAPDISLSNPKGKVISLSSLQGKVVLVDFWASWCKPCRAENPNNVKLYKKYKSKGFEIFGVSLDKEKSEWEQAIKKDGLEWTHVSDLGFWNSSAVKLYNVEGIPMTYLLDKKGKILAKGLTGDELEAKVKEALGL